MKKILSIILLIIVTNSCSKDETEINEEIVETIETNAIIDIIEGIDIATITINNGFEEITITGEEFDIDIQSEITSVFSENNEIIYIHNKWLAKSNTSSKTTKTNKTEVELTPRETAKAIIFESTGMSMIDPSENFAISMGYIMDNDPAIKKYVDQLETVIKNDIKNNKNLTQFTYEHKVLEDVYEFMQTTLDISSKILDWPSTVVGLLDENRETELKLHNVPAFLNKLRIEGTTGDEEENFYYEKMTKYGSVHGICVLDITGASKIPNTNSYDIQLDFYNKTPAYRYATEMNISLSGNRIYAKDTLRNIIKPYNSAAMWKNLTSFRDVISIIEEGFDVMNNGITADNLHTTQSVKSEVDLVISAQNPYFLLGNVKENNDLLVYATIELLARGVSVLQDFCKASAYFSKTNKDGKEENDDKHLTDLLVAFQKYLKEKAPSIVERITKLGLKIRDNKNSENVKNEIVEITKELSKQFFSFINKQVTNAAIETFFEEQIKKETIYGKVTNIGYLKEAVEVIKAKDVTVDNFINVLGKAFPFFKVVKKTLNVGMLGIDVSIFMLNNNPQVREKLFYLPLENETSPKHLERLDENKLIISFDEEINLQNTNSKKVFIRKVVDHSIVKSLTANELIIKNNNKTLEIPIYSIDQGDYYVFIPEDFIFNNDGYSFQGVYTKYDWQFKVEEDIKIERTITLISPEDNTEVTRDNNTINFSWDFTTNDNTSPTKYKLTIAEYEADNFKKEHTFVTTEKNVDVEINSFQTTTTNFKWQVIAEDVNDNEWSASLVYNFTIEKNINTPSVTTVTPLNAELNTQTTFTIKGTNLKEGMGFWIADLSDITEVNGGNSNERYFKGTPTNSIGIKDGVVKDTPGGTTLFNFQVTIENPVQNIYSGNVTLTTQQQVDDFGANNYTKIEGNLLIEGNHNNDITSLSSLNSLIEVNGDFKIFQNNLLTNLDGLNNIKTISGILHIGGNNNLTNINDFNNIISIGALQIAGEDSLANIDSLSKVTSVSGSIHIYNNDLISNLYGLSNIETIGGEISINHNDNLTDLNLSKLSSIGLDLQIIENNKIIDLNYLSNITSIEGDLRITNNSGLINLCGVKNLIKNNIITSNEYTVYGNSYNPTYEQIQNTGNGGCEQ